uniref:Uncharacterized protein n=1 Tax=Tanacetum cinerariifolium TaxID=118510 RepID=A0A699HZ87_TANCI|nr:hypothetical protein [Tanacetum cinerariifolium]
MVPEPGDPDHEVPVAKTFHEQTDEEFTKKEVMQMEADDQAIQTIFMGLPKDIYATVDIYETAQEIWLHVQQMMKGSDIGIQEKKAKNQFRQYARQNIRNQNRIIVVLGIANSNVNQNGNGNVTAARAEGDLEDIKEVNANCILMSNLQQALASRYLD